MENRVEVALDLRLSRIANRIYEVMVTDDFEIGCDDKNLLISEIKEDLKSQEGTIALLDMLCDKYEEGRC